MKFDEIRMENLMKTLFRMKRKTSVQSKNTSKKKIVFKYFKKL